MSLNEHFLTEEFRRQHTSRLSSEKLESRFGLGYLSPNLLREVAKPTVVDVGCGGGQASELLCGLHAAAEYTGLDFSPAMLAEARRRYPDRRFEQFEFEDRLPFAGGSVDLVFAYDLIEHIAQPYALLVEGLRVTRRFLALNFRCSRLDEDLEFRKPHDIRFNVLSFRRVRECIDTQLGQGLRVRLQVDQYQPYRAPEFTPIRPLDAVRRLEQIDGPRKVRALLERTGTGRVEWLDETTKWEHRGYLTPIDPLTRLWRRWFILKTPRTWARRRRHRHSLH